MVNSAKPCHSAPTGREKRWPYEEYYIGERDCEGRKNGQGENHWSGAESLEWYTGRMLRDTMHGLGDYRWRHRDPDGAAVTYEGHFFANRMHGYGMMSYPDGRVFTGLYYNDVRWGPGLERTTDLKASVGLWRGTQLARLAWRPAGPTVAPDLTMGAQGPSFLNPFRTVLTRNTKIIGDTNSALELLKRFGDPVLANEKWMHLYSKFCTNMDSDLCYKDLFDHHYYKGKIHTLKEVVDTYVIAELSSQVDNNELVKGNGDDDEATLFYAWNNNPTIVHMMKHSYQHERQRSRTRLNLEKILNGPRKQFKPASKHEIDCRSLLMACYAGVIASVAQLVNEEDVYPDIADSQGNTALMYAVCGDQPRVIHFLVEAGANINSINDSCCTPLGVALMRYLCIARDAAPYSMCQVLLPPKKEKTEVVSQNEDKITEWHINRDHSGQDIPIAIDTKSERSPSAKKLKTITTKAQIQSGTQKSLDQNKPAQQEQNYDSDNDIFSNEKKVFTRIQGEYSTKIAIQFAPKAAVNLNTYLFVANDMVKDVLDAEEEIHKSQTDKPVTVKKVISKPKTISKLMSKMVQGQGAGTRESITNYINEKSDLLSKIELTILQLLKDGADPKLVRCPQPAILLATKAGSTDLVKHMASFHTNVDEKNPEMMNYTALDMIISEPFTKENLEMIHALLELGADTRHQFKYEDPAQVADASDTVPRPPEGPTLLHAVIAKKAETEQDECIRRDIITLLLKYNADPVAQFHGRSPIDIAMMRKLDVLETFIKFPSTDLNAIINEQNQTILMKLFSRDYFKFTMGINKLPTLSNLLLHGADPLIRSFDGDVLYENVFEFAKKTLNEIAPFSEKEKPIRNGKGENGKEKNTKSQTKMKSKQSLEDKKGTKNLPTEGPEYREALYMMRDCARLLHVRWLQGRLFNELVGVVFRFKHRHWTMIIKEHNNRHNFGLWVSSLRCLEIWDIMKTIHKKKYSNDNILRIMLSIAQFYQTRLKAQREITVSMSAVEKNIIEKDVRPLMKEHRTASALTEEAEVWKRAYVKPELDYKALQKYKVCFECGLRLCEGNIPCDYCGLVSFCDIDCLTANLERNSGHPCSKLLAENYLPPNEDFETMSRQVIS